MNSSLSSLQRFREGHFGNHCPEKSTTREGRFSSGKNFSIFNKKHPDLMATGLVNGSYRS